MATLPNLDKRTANIYLGDVLGQPLYVTVSELFRHMWLRGMSGAGKTALLSGLVHQLIDFSGRQRNLSVVITDFKGDNALLYEAMSMAARHRLPFKLLNTMTGCATHVFNPWTQPYLERHSPVVRTELFGDSLGLLYGQEYGRGFFGSMNEGGFLDLFESGKRVPSFRDASTAISELNPSERQLELLRHMLNTFRKMAYVPFMNHTCGEAARNQVDIGAIFDEPQVVYGYLPSSFVPQANYTIVRFLLAHLMAASWEKPPGTRNGVVIICDEVQKVINATFQTFLDQARSQQIGCIFAHQYGDQLRTLERDFYPILSKGTNIQFDFTPSLHPEEYRDYKYRDYVWSYSESYSTCYSRDPLDDTEFSEFVLTAENLKSEVSMRLQEMPLYTLMDDLMPLTYSPNKCMINIQQRTEPLGAGGIPYPGRVFYHISEQEYERRNAMPPPAEAVFPGMLINRAWNAVPRTPRLEHSRELVDAFDGAPSSTPTHDTSDNTDPWSGMAEWIQQTRPPR